MVGAHWIALDFGHMVKMSHIRLDWEAAYADNYLIKVRSDDKDDWNGKFINTLFTFFPHFM